MNINIRTKDGVAILDLSGNIDINASDFVEAVGAILNNKTLDILCNFECVNLIDYVGVSLIAVIYKNVLNHKGRIKLFNVPSHIMGLFAVVGLDRVFEYYLNEEEALAAIKEDRRFSRILSRQLRRRFKRMITDTNIEYKPKVSSDNCFYKGRIINLSAEGVFVSSARLFSLGDILIIRINLLPEPGRLQLDTKVVWVADKEMQPYDSPGMGLEFHNLTALDQEKIVQFVEKHIVKPK